MTEGGRRCAGQSLDSAAAEAKIGAAEGCFAETKKQVFQKTYIFVKILLAIPDG